MELKDWQIDLVMKCLSGNINDRFNTCEELSINIKEKVQFKKNTMFLLSDDKNLHR